MHSIDQQDAVSSRGIDLVLPAESRISSQGCTFFVRPTGEGLLRPTGALCLYVAYPPQTIGLTSNPIPLSR